MSFPTKIQIRPTKIRSPWMDGVDAATILPGIAALQLHLLPTTLASWPDPTRKKPEVKACSAAHP